MTDSVPYYVPLADGRYARFRLPADLTEEDAERLGAMIRALAFPAADARTLPAGGA